MLAAVAVLAMSVFAACGGSSKTDANDTVDSVEVVTDSLAVDSISVDSMSVDSTAFVKCSCAE